MVIEMYYLCIDAYIHCLCGVARHSACIPKALRCSTYAHKLHRYAHAYITLLHPFNLCANAENDVAWASGDRC
ncbi:unnamed protein product [Trichogramma brassicae]|uniref:Uncharacterized protein n=1 Tax=Trichogramma brassicae TaxID=86971 RepID=A0A6H5J0Z9_9HYME|nr:unnamed protein product [Trichogramma brassicae]